MFLDGWLKNQKLMSGSWEVQERFRAVSWVDNESIMNNSRVACLTNENMFKSPAQVRPFPETSWGNMKSNRHCIRPAFMSVQWKLFMSKRGFIVHEWTVKKHSERRSDEKMFMSGCSFVKNFHEQPRGFFFFHEWRLPGWFWQAFMSRDNRLS